MSQHFHYCKSKSQSSQVKYSKADTRRRMNFSELLEDVKSQIEFFCFSPGDVRQAEEIALIIAEIFKLPENTTVRIAGNDLPADLVAAVFEKLTNDNIQEVIRHYRQATYEIKHVKTYLRTSLYNSVFETEARIDNEVRKDNPEF